jgi:hypothetical protein
MIFADYPGHFITLALVVVFAGLVVLAYRCREMQKENIRPYRFLLMGLRYASIIMLLVILFNPSRSITVDEVARNSVLTFFDTSRSMSVIEEAELSRLDKAVAVFNESFRPTNTKGPQYRILGFDNQVYYSGSTQLLRRWGTRTNLQNVFSELGQYNIADQEDKNLFDPGKSGETSPDVDNSGRLQVSAVKGAVIFTDGQTLDQNIDSYLSMVRDDFPIVIVGIGSKEHQADIGIKSFRTPARSAVDSVYNVEVVVTAAGLNKEPVVIELLRDNKVIDSKKVDSQLFSQPDSEAKNEVAVNFLLGADNLGSHSLTARAQTDEHEVNTANNERVAIVEVVEPEQLKVLFYTQAVNFDVGKLRQALARDDRIELTLGLDAIKTFGLYSEVSKRLGYVSLPKNQQEFNQYDIIILGQCLLDNLTNEQIDGLCNFVTQRGGGIVLLPGRGDYGPAAWKNPKIRLLFPVIFEKDDPKLWPPEPGRIELTREAFDMNILGPDDVRDRDIEISPFYKISKVKPAANTLATSGKNPIVTLHRVGRGRVCLLNISRLFLLYREDEQGGLLYKLMSGLTSYIGKTTRSAAGVQLFAERADTEDNQVRFSALVSDDSFAAVEQANVLLHIKDSVLTMNPAGRGHYVAVCDNVELDTIIATAQAEIGGIFLGEKTIAVNLPPRKTEMADTQFNEEFLKALAEHVKGTYIHADDTGRDIAGIFDAQTRLGTTRRMASVWPRWPLFAVLCILLTTEWFLKRAKGLV